MVGILTHKTKMANIFSAKHHNSSIVIVSLLLVAAQSIPASLSACSVAVEFWSPFLYPCVLVMYF